MSVSYVYHVNRLEAFSTEEGITFSSRAFVDIPKMCVSVTYNEEGKPQSTVHNESIRIVEEAYYKEHPARKKDTSFYSGCTCILTALVYFIICAIVRTKVFTSCALFSLISICATNALVHFGSYVGNIVYMVKHPSISRFHSAEHMAVKAFHKKEEMPSMEEIKQTSRFDVECSQVDGILVPFVTSLVDSIILIVLIISVHFGLIAVLDQLYGTIWFVAIMPVVAFYYFINEKLLSVVNPLIKKLFEHEVVVKFFQSPMLFVPTEKELIIAEEALRQRELMDQDIMKHAEDYITESVCFNPKEGKTMFILVNGKQLYSTIDEYIGWIESYKNAELSETDDGGDTKNT